MSRRTLSWAVGLAVLFTSSACQRLKECGAEYAECPSSYHCVDYTPGTPGRCELTQEGGGPGIDAGGMLRRSCSFVQALYGSTNSSFGGAVATNGASVLVGAPAAGKAQLYDLIGDSLVEDTGFRDVAAANSGGSGSEFGRSVALYPAEAFVLHLSAAVRLRKSGPQWVADPSYDIPSGSAHSVVSNGSYVALGGLDVGATDVYVYRPSERIPCKRISPSATTSLPGFADALGWVGGTLLLGAYGGQSNPGSVHKAQLSCTPTNPETAQPLREMSAPISFGKAIGASGSTLVVGAPKQTGMAPSFFSYRQNGEAWENASDGPLRDHGPMGGQAIGSALAIDGDLVVVGAPGQSGGKGGATIYQRLAGQWVSLYDVDGASISASLGRPILDLGQSVAVTGSLVVLGAPLTQATGAALVYRCQ